MQFFITFLLSLFISTYSYSIDTKANQAIVIDFNTQEVLFEKNADKLMAPASMTKIMTLYIVFDRLQKTDLSINDTCNISPKAYKMGGSRTFLEIDEKVSINDLLKGIIVQSGNDASVALAECLSGTETDFANLMNIYANKLDMQNSNFINSSGWPEKNHYSTVRDLGILSSSLIRDFKKFYEYFRLKEFTYNEIKQPNRNKLLTSFNGADGLKTGYTKKSGWGISGSAIKEDRRIIVVINGTNSSRSRLNESSNLLNWAFSQTSQKKLFSKRQIIKKVDTWLGSESYINLIIDNDVISTLSYDQIQLISSKLSYSSPISAPIIKGDKLGSIQIIIPGKSHIIVPLVAEKDIDEINPLLRVFAAIKYLIFGTSLDES
mgnify:CR=1 FL=1